MEEACETKKIKKNKIDYLLDLRDLRKEKDYELTRSGWERKLKVSSGNPITRRIFTELIQNNVMFLSGYTDNKKKYMLYKIDLKDLWYCIEDIGTVKRLLVANGEPDFIFPRIKKKKNMREN